MDLKSYVENAKKKKEKSITDILAIEVQKLTEKGEKSNDKHVQ